MPNPPGSWLRQLQEWGQTYLSFSLPVIMGQYGIFPRQAPLVVVVGKPIAVPKVNRPTKDQIQQYHAQYTQALEALFDKYKDKYAPNRKHPDLRIVQ